MNEQDLKKLEREIAAEPISVQKNLLIFGYLMILAQRGHLVNREQQKDLAASVVDAFRALVVEDVVEVMMGLLREGGERFVAELVKLSVATNDSKIKTLQRMQNLFDLLENKGD